MEIQEKKETPAISLIVFSCTGIWISLPPKPAPQEWSLTYGKPSTKTMGILILWPVPWKRWARVKCFLSWQQRGIADAVWEDFRHWPNGGRSKRGRETTHFEKREKMMVLIAERINMGFLLLLSLLFPQITISLRDPHWTVYSLSVKKQNSFLLLLTALGWGTKAMYHCSPWPAAHGGSSGLARASATSRGLLESELGFCFLLFWFFSGVGVSLPFCLPTPALFSCFFFTGIYALKSRVQSRKDLLTPVKKLQTASDRKKGKGKKRKTVS